MTCHTKIFLFFLMASIVISKSLYAETESNWFLSASANFNISTFSKAQNIDSQNELGLFIDADYLESFSLSAGLIYQNQGLNSFSNISNSIQYLGAAYHMYPESLPGKLTFSIETYKESENTTVRTTRTMGPGTGPGMPPTVITETEIINDSLKIYNPVISYLNYKKTFYADLGYANSEYGSTDSAIGVLKVKQWTPTIGFAFNDQYDWLQIRHYNIDLSNDIRSPDVTKTTANEIKLTHWFENKEDTSLDNIQFIVLSGERLFAVDHDARKIYNLADMQTAIYSIGGNWKHLNGNRFYIYAGIEEYEDTSSNEDFNNVFLYLGYKINW